MYYAHIFKFDEKVANVSRNRFIDAVIAELPEAINIEGHGPLLGFRYVRPLYLQPLFQKKVPYGSSGYPFTEIFSQERYSYRKGICPIAEKMHEKELFCHEFMLPGMSIKDLDGVLNAFDKV